MNMISDSVGYNGKNSPADVLIIKHRFIELGFSIPAFNDTMENSTIDTIKLYQSILKGRQTIGASTDGVDGRIDAGGGTFKSLNAANAPGWGRLPAGSRTNKTFGFYNYDLEQSEGHDYGATWLLDCIKLAGSIYYQKWIVQNPKAAVFEINEMSSKNGGPLAPHKGHQCGLCFDVRVPRLDGNSGGITYKDKNFDRNTARSIMQTFLSLPNFNFKIFFNDPLLINERLCVPIAGHDDHMHFQIGTVPAVH